MGIINAFRSVPLEDRVFFLCIIGAVLGGIGSSVSRNIKSPFDIFKELYLSGLAGILVYFFIVHILKINDVVVSVVGCILAGYHSKKSLRFLLNLSLNAGGRQCQNEKEDE